MARTGLFPAKLMVFLYSELVALNRLLIDPSSRYANSLRATGTVTAANPKSVMLPYRRSPVKGETGVNGFPRIDERHQTPRIAATPALTRVERIFETTPSAVTTAARIARSAPSTIVVWRVPAPAR